MSETLKDQLAKMGLLPQTSDQPSPPAAPAPEPEPEPEPKAPEDSEGVQESVEALVRSNTLRNTRGPNRWYYVTRDERVPYMECSDRLVGQLQSGQAAIAESPEGAVTVIDGQTAARVAAIDRRWLVAWSGRVV